MFVHDDQNPVGAHRVEAYRPHHKARNHAAFDVKCVFRHFVQIACVHDIRVKDEPIASGAKQPGNRRRIARVAANLSVNARRHQHDGAEIFGVLATPVDEAEYRVRLTRRIVRHHADFAVIMLRVCLRHDEANRYSGVCQVEPRRLLDMRQQVSVPRSDWDHEFFFR